MTIAYWCVLTAMMLPYVFIVIAKAGAENMNNRTPQIALENLQGWQKRAYWAQKNAFEAFPPFAAAVIIAHQLQVPRDLLDPIAVGFILCRVLHGVFYITDKPSLRSLAWLGGILCVISLFMLSSRLG